MDETREHIFKGVVNDKGASTGWHYLGKSNPPGNKIVKVLEDADEFGTISAEVEIQGVLKNGFSTFFSNDYTQDEVVEMIMEAHNGRNQVPNTHGRYRGKAANGMTIEMSIFRNSTGTNIADIISAYPVHSSQL